MTEDLRLIVHRGETSLPRCYVDLHTAAYAWAERRKLETHPSTGAARPLTAGAARPFAR